jgi:phage gp46-like protein
MSDIRLHFDPILGEFDTEIVNGDPDRDEGLETAVWISLFSDQRSPDTDDRRGWWADETLPDNDHIGSLLWTLFRRGIDSNFLNDAKQYAEDALAWLLTDLVATDVIVTVTRTDRQRVTFEIKITKPGNVTHRYKYAWDSMGNTVLALSE